jgi:hypothetical protein
MKLFRVFGLVLLFVLSIASVQAAEDFLAPTKISFSVKPGEKLSYDLVYKSGIGGTYDLSTRVFEYDQYGNKKYVADSSDLVTYSESIFEFDVGEEKKVPINISIPEDFPNQDLYMSHFLRRRSDEQQTFELGSLMFLRVGPVSEFSGKVSNAKFHHLSDTPDGAQTSGRFHGILFDFENTSDRYFFITPVLKLYDSSGNLFDTLENQSTYVFPEFVKTVNFFNFSEKDVDVADKRMVLQVLSEDKSVLHEEELSLDDNQVFASQERRVSPFQSLAIRKGILYNPTFQIAAIVIGLTLVAFSLFMKRK